MSIDAASTKYWSDRGGVVLVNDPVETVHEVAEAYDIRWLVLDGGESVPIARPDPRRRPARLGRSADRPVPGGRCRDPDPHRGRSGPGGLPGLHDHRPIRAARRPRDPARDRALRAGHLRRRAGRPRHLRHPDRVPEARGHGLLRGRGPQPRRRSRPRLRRDLELPDAPAGLPAARLRGVAAPPDLPRGDPDARVRRDVRGRAGLVDPDRGARAGARLAPGRGCRRGARPARQDGHGPSRSAPAS